jgi:hypothetical protein
MFRHSCQGNWAAGSIHHIFSLSPTNDELEEQIFLHVKKYNNVSSRMVPAIVQEFPNVLGQLFSLNQTSFIVLQLEEVDGQFCFAKTDYGSNIFQAIPANKVSCGTDIISMLISSYHLYSKLDLYAIVFDFV